MKKKIIRKLITTQKLTKYTKVCFIKKFFKNNIIKNYGGGNELNVNINRTTKYVPVCTIQGRFKKTLKIFQFNRHIIRTNTIKHQFESLHSNVW